MEALRCSVMPYNISFCTERNGGKKIQLALLLPAPWNQNVISILNAGRWIKIACVAARSIHRLLTSWFLQPRTHPRKQWRPRRKSNNLIITPRRQDTKQVLLLDPKYTFTTPQSQPCPLEPFSLTPDQSLPNHPVYLSGHWSLERDRMPLEVDGMDSKWNL